MLRDFRLRRAVLAVLACTGWILGPCRPATAQTSSLDSLRAAFEAMRYDQAVEIGQRILSQPGARTPEELSATHELLGIIAYNQNRTSAARAHFESLLSLEPDYELDPLYASPKVRDFFRRIKRSWQPGSIPSETPVRYIRVPDPRLGAAWRSLVFPGWGHLYRGERKLGRALVGSAACLAAATGVFYGYERKARDEYLSATDPAEIARMYDRYNRYYRLRHRAATMLGLLWLGAYLDASLRPVKRVKVAAAVRVPGRATPTLVVTVDLLPAE